MFKNRKVIILIACALLVIAAGWIAWSKTASPTKIALVNFQPFQTTSIVKAKNDKFVKYEVLSVDKLDKTRGYDFVLAFGMGLKISDEQRDRIQKLTDKGLPFMVISATNPENNICSLDSIHQADVRAYWNNPVNLVNTRRILRMWRNFTKKSNPCA